MYPDDDAITLIQFLSIFVGWCLSLNDERLGSWIVEDTNVIPLCVVFIILDSDIHSCFFHCLFRSIGADKGKTIDCKRLHLGLGYTWSLFPDETKFVFKKLSQTGKGKRLPFLFFVFVFYRRLPAISISPHARNSPRMYCLCM